MTATCWVTRYVKGRAIQSLRSLSSISVRFVATRLPLSGGPGSASTACFAGVEYPAGMELLDHLLVT